VIEKGIAQMKKKNVILMVEIGIAWMVGE